MAAVNSANIGVTAIKPVERHGLEAVRYFFHNPETGQIMGRTPMSWLQITVFYIIYYACLAGFWALCLFIFFQTIDDRVPKWTEDASLIGRSGALGVRPNQSMDYIDSGMIMFNVAEEESVAGRQVAGWGEWAERSNHFLQAYRDAEAGVDCSSGARPGPGEFCQFPLSSLGACAEGQLGYDMGRPCVYLKLNKIYGLEPDYYTDTADLPEGFPDRLKELMGGLAGDDLKRVWVDCHGENPADDEAIGDIRYFPAQSGFSDKYFPYLNQPGYLPPLVAVQFLNPTAGQLVHIECRAWAGNIGYDRRDKLGKAHFELMIHNVETAKAVEDAVR